MPPSPSPISMANCIDKVPEDFRESLRQANVDNLLAYLSSKSDQVLRLGKNEQRGEPDLTAEEKVNILRNKFDDNPKKFLATYGQILEPSHLDCFKEMRKDSYEVDFYLTDLEKKLSPEAKKKTAKNRRYEALQKLVDTTDYFTEEEMQRRNPILFDQLIGRFHTEAEREAFLFQSASTSSAVGSKNDSSYDAKARPTPLSDMLIAHMSRIDGECSSRRLGQESQINDENAADKECYEDSDEEMEEEEPRNGRNSDQNNQEITEEVDDEEKELLKEEFFTTMYRHFLEGKDEDIDYSQIDDNPEYDVGETFAQDEEEKYFDTEEPAIADENSNSSMQCSNPASPRIEKTCNGKIEDTEEDELDAYMKTLEAEMQK